MKGTYTLGGLALLLAALFLIGCAEDKPAGPAAKDKAPKVKSKQEKIEEALAKLSPEDRKLAEVQGYCPVMTEHRLGEMGKPHKVMLKGQPVFLCCSGCEDEALGDPDKTLAKVKELKEKAKGGQGKP